MVTQVSVAAYPYANNAKVYIGEKLCCTLPENVEDKKVYNFNFDDTFGDYIKIVSARDDGVLWLYNVIVYTETIKQKVKALIYDIN